MDALDGYVQEIKKEVSGHLQSTVTIVNPTIARLFVRFPSAPEGLWEATAHVGLLHILVDRSTEVNRLQMRSLADCRTLLFDTELFVGFGDRYKVARTDPPFHVIEVDGFVAGIQFVNTSHAKSLRDRLASFATRPNQVPRTVLSTVGNMFGIKAPAGEPKKWYKPDMMAKKANMMAAFGQLLSNNQRPAPPPPELRSVAEDTPLEQDDSKFNEVEKGILKKAGIKKSDLPRDQESRRYVKSALQQVMFQRFFAHCLSAVHCG